MMRTWDFLVDRADLSRTEVREARVPDGAELADGEVLLALERFSLTANNVTYAVFGDRLGYWRFFPAPDGWGRVPVWGFAKVLASRADGVEPGLRLYGYWPMSTHHVTRIRPSGIGFTDGSDHRAALPAAYNRYEVAPETARDDKLALLRPLFTTSFLLDDWLAEAAPEATSVLSSASSRTAVGLAWLLARRGAPAVALTSARNRAFVEGLGLYGRTATYEEVASLEVDGPVAYVDMAGDAAVRASIHRRFGDRLVRSVIVGGTHHDAPAGDAAALPGAQPAFFFAPDQLARRRDEWGGAVLAGKVDAALRAFVDGSGWLSVERHNGSEALQSAYQAVLSGSARPAIGYLVLPA